MDLPDEALPKDEAGIGRGERRRHIELIKQGANSYMIMCQAKDVSAEPRDIKSVNCDDVFVGGRIVETDTGTWLEIVGRMPVRNVAA